MSILERIVAYEQRGFLRPTAIVNVLLEEAVSVVFKEYPDKFVLFGGASLVLFYNSIRHSGDLDLLLQSDGAPTAAELIEQLTPVLSEAAQILGLPALGFKTLYESGNNLRKLAVKAGEQVLFTIDVSQVTATLKSEIVEIPLQSEYVADAKIKLPSRDLLLLYKLEAFLKRKTVKARDAFDTKLLIDSGAALSDTLKVHLSDGPAAERVEDPDFIAHRIHAITPEACAVELRPYLPAEVYAELAKDGFESLRSTMRQVLRDWLEE